MEISEKFISLYRVVNNKILGTGIIAKLVTSECNIKYANISKMYSFNIRTRSTGQMPVPSGGTAPTFREESPMEKRKLQEDSRRVNSFHEKSLQNMKVGEYNIDNDIIKINIKDSQDKKYPVRIDLSRTVAEMKQFLEKDYGQMPASTKFLYGGKQMENSKSLKYYNFLHEHVIIMTGSFHKDTSQKISADFSRKIQQEETTKPKKINSIHSSTHNLEALTYGDNQRNALDYEYGGKNFTLVEKKESQKSLQSKKDENKTNVTAKDLVSILAKSNNFRLSIVDLIDDCNIRPSSIKIMIENEPHIFTVQNSIVTLNPKIYLCVQYNNNGCQNRNDCSDLHICSQFVDGKCSSTFCLFGHKWSTNHNSTVLRKFNIIHLPSDLICKLIKSTVMNEHQLNSSFDICSKYNNGGCILRNCHFLHICINLVKNKKECKLPRCRLNHNILDESCTDKLHKLGISTNETPADILDELSEMLQINQEIIDEERTQIKINYTSQQKDLSLGGKFTLTEGNHDEKNSLSNRYSNKHDNDSGASSGLYSSSNNSNNFHPSNPSSYSMGNQSSARSSSQSASYSADLISSHSMPNPRSSGSSLSNMNYSKAVTSSSYSPSSKEHYQNQTASYSSQHGYNSIHTNTSQYSSGSVGYGRKMIVDTISEYGSSEVPEICYYSVINKCKFENFGCRRLHSTRHYHWQVQKITGTWINLHSHQVEFLEKYYCNPAHDTIVIPDLQKMSKTQPTKELSSLSGNNSWIADFQNMYLNSRVGKLNIRRLTSENLIGCPVSSNTYIWYFQDENKRWIEYGNVNSLGRQQLKSTINSKDIEKEYRTYQNNKNKNVMMFDNALFNYIIDFDTNTQTNTKSMVKRSIKRRPELRNNV
ncbi:unnamed protein product, partial [Meganyctiphanes norvegica]